MMFLKSVLCAVPLVHAQFDDGMMLLQQHAQKKMKRQWLPEQIGTNKRCAVSASAVFFKKCSDLSFTEGRCENESLGKGACIAKCDADPNCVAVAHWPKSNKHPKRKNLCFLFPGGCRKKRKIKGDSNNVLIRVREETTTTGTTTPPMTTGTTTPLMTTLAITPEPIAIAGAGECNPDADQLCVWRHTDDNNTCDEEGCGNRAEFRKKFAELPPIEAPINAEPDAVIAENGGVPPPQKQFHNLHFTKVSDNDLGGGGIRYVDVTTLEVNGEDHAIDCIVTASGYEGFKPSKNGLAPGEKIGAINIMHSTTVDLTYSFIFQDTGAPATMGEFFFSVFDMDTGKGYKKKGKKVQSVEKLTISGYVEYYLIPQEKGGEIVVTPHASGADFEGSTWGRARDNPSDPLVLDERQAKRSVSFKFAPGRSSFDLTYDVGEAVRGGRNFMFSGMTNLYFCKAPKVNLDFNMATVTRNNLGGKGPESGEEGIFYSNIASIDGEQIDLEINALEPYFPFNIDMNGLNGQFAQINMGTPSPTGWTGTCEFKFSLVKGGAPYEAEWLYFSMFDLDQAKSNKKWNPKWQESLTVSGFASQYISDGTEIKIEQLDKRTYRYNSSKKGTGKDNPKDPMKLDSVMLSRTATFVYRAVSSWTAKFAIGLPSAINGRNFLLAGKSSTVSCDQNTYGDVINVQNHVTPPPR